MNKKYFLVFLLLTFHYTAGYFETMHRSVSTFFESVIESVNQFFSNQKQTMIVHEVWNKKAYNQRVPDKIKAFKDSVYKGTQENKKIPEKTAELLRIASYNVHFWHAPGKKWNDQTDEKQIFKTIKTINADILILQEVRTSRPFKSSDISTKLKQIGYKSISACNTFPPEKDWFGVIIASKIEPTSQKRVTFKNQERPGKEDRCYVQSSFSLKNKKKLLVYGTHLEVGKLDTKGQQPASEQIRKKQIKELLKSIEYEQTKNPTSNILLGADFNSIRMQDYQYTINGKKVWNLVQNENKKIFGYYPTPTDTLDILKQYGFKDSFSYLGWVGPKFTTWTGTVIDFIFLSPTWNLPVSGSYLYYSSASDHLPIILDIKL